VIVIRNKFTVGYRRTKITRRSWNTFVRYPTL